MGVFAKLYAHMIAQPEPDPQPPSDGPEWMPEIGGPRRTADGFADDTCVEHWYQEIGGEG